MSIPKNLEPATCTTASEAFKYPLPQVRQFHRTLTAELDEKNARLRTLVGGSYRQLLGTAEMILHMKDDISEAEEKLARVGRGCGRAVISNMVGGLARLHERGEGIDAGRQQQLSWAARMKVLSMCVVTMGRLLRRPASADQDAKGKRGENLVLAAKVWVLSRLLAKRLGDSMSERRLQDKEAIDHLRKKLGSLKRRLLRAIEKTLTRHGTSDARDDLVQALCAYSLATSFGAKDVLRYFLRVRGEAMVLAFHEKEDEHKEDVAGVLKALHLYIRTLIDVQALIPRRLSDALLRLKSKPLLQDDLLREIEALRLDVCEKWFGDQILFFTPYVKHDDLVGPQAVDTLKNWAKHASQVLLQGLEKSLQTTPDFKQVVELRTKILEVWIGEGGKARGMDPSLMLDGLRKALNARLVQLLEARVAKLHLVGTEVEATLAGWQSGITDKHGSLWDEDLLTMEISNGAAEFKQAVLDRAHGRNDPVSRAFQGYQTWRHLVGEIITFLEQLKKQKWDNDLEDIEDDESIESRSIALSQDDPKMLQGRLDASLEKAYGDLQDKVRSLFEVHKDTGHIAPISIYLLRILRDIRAGLSPLPALESFGLSLVPLLHEIIANSVSIDPISRLERSFRAKRVAGRALWEGSPELPVQPAPGTFRFLHGLSLRMAIAGADLWSPTAVKVLKARLRSELGRTWSSALSIRLENREPVVNGTQSSADEEEVTTDIVADKGVSEKNEDKEVLVQALFDMMILNSSLELEGVSVHDEFDKLQDMVKSELVLDADAEKRLHGSARDYWKRACLLFGLLA